MSSILDTSGRSILRVESEVAALDRVYEVGGSVKLSPLGRRGTSRCA